MLQGRRAAIAAFAVAAVAAVTAGCGGGSSSSTGLKLDPVSAAATKTQNAGAARVRFTLAFGGSGLSGKKVRLRGSGAIDGTSAVMSFRLASLLGQSGLGLPAGAKSATMAQIEHARVKEIVLEQKGDYVIYMRLPFLSADIPGHKQWMELDLSKLGKSAGIDFGQLMSGSQLEPTDMLSMLKSEGGTVQTLGRATTDGVATTGYRVKIDTAKAFKAEGVTSPALLQMASKVKTISANVWIGEDGLVRRVQFAYSAPQQAARVSMAMDLYDYGAHVSIAAPPSGQVFDATQFAQQGLGSTH